MIEQGQPIADGENYRDTKTYGFKDIVLKQVQRIVVLYSQELTEGFMKYSQLSSYGSQEPIAYISDGRIAYYQAVEVLHDLLMPKFDQEMKDAAKEILKEINVEYTKLKEEAKKVTIKKDIWYDKKVEIMRKMFQQLCLFLERLGWLEEQSLED
jgi:hypothetical protein